MTAWDLVNNTLWKQFCWGQANWDDGPDVTTYTDVSDASSTYTTMTAASTTWSAD